MATHRDTRGNGFLNCSGCLGEAGFHVSSGTRRDRRGGSSGLALCTFAELAAEDTARLIRSRQP